MRGRERVQAILSQDNNVLMTARHRSLRSTVWRMKKAGCLVEVLPGVCVPPECKNDPATLLAAVANWAPQAVFIGRTAEQLLAGGTVSLPLHIALQSSRSVPTWLRRMRRTVPPDRVVSQGGLPVADPRYLAVESAARDRGKALFDLLREDSNAIPELVPTLRWLRGSRGQVERAKVVHACRNRPWSYPELELQQLLLNHGISDWIANHPLRIGSTLIRADLYFPDVRLAIEFDSWEFHSSRTAFESDRRKENLLTISGARTLRITWEMLSQDPDGVVATVRAALRACAA